MTGSMERAIAETDRRREKQVAYNEANGITPTTIKRNIAAVVAHVASGDYVTPEIDEETSNLVGHNLRAYIADRSEEPTSELQSPLSNPYPVSCLKKQIKQQRARTR